MYLPRIVSRKSPKNFNSIFNFFFRFLFLKKSYLFIWSRDLILWELIMPTWQMKDISPTRPVRQIWVSGRPGVRSCQVRKLICPVWSSPTLENQKINYLDCIKSNFFWKLFCWFFSIYLFHILVLCSSFMAQNWSGIACFQKNSSL